MTSSPQKAHHILVNEGVLKRFRNKTQIIYRLKAEHLGKSFCNIDQSCEDLSTHLKWNDKNGLSFLSEFFDAYIAREKANKALKSVIDFLPWKEEPDRLGRIS